MEPHEILRVPRDASEEQIKAAYRAEAKKAHPDHNQGQGAERFHRIASAYDRLSREARRRAATRSSARRTSSHFRAEPRVTTTFRVGHPFKLPTVSLKNIFSLAA